MTANNFRKQLRMSVRVGWVLNGSNKVVFDKAILPSKPKFGCCAEIWGVKSMSTNLASSLTGELTLTLPKGVNNSSKKSFAN
ncbi:hypothetical protein NSMS1_65060 (plasmid) [Nostoc sp. MS1]|nr:hypothetical protein NSMS1_65060 [Nostoc sp. MS1]